MPVIVLIVEDQRLYLDALKSQVRILSPLIEIVTASNEAEALKVLGAGPLPTYVLTDLILGEGGASLAVIKQCAQLKIPVAVISGTYDAQLVRDCLRAGAAAFIPKDWSIPQMACGIDLFFSGAAFAPLIALPVEAESDSILSDEDLVIVRAIRDGINMKVIARTLKRNEAGVRSQVTRMVRKLGGKSGGAKVIISLVAQHGIVL